MIIPKKEPEAVVLPFGAAYLAVYGSCTVLVFYSSHPFFPNLVVLCCSFQPRIHPQYRHHAYFFSPCAYEDTFSGSVDHLSLCCYVARVLPPRLPLDGLNEHNSSLSGGGGSTQCCEMCCKGFMPCARLAYSQLCQTKLGFARVITVRLEIPMMTFQVPHMRGRKGG